MEKKNYRLIACDLDETLLTSDKKVSLKNKEAIARAAQKGVRFVVSTGRPFYSVQNTLKEIGLDQKEGEYSLVLNGAQVVEHGSKKALFSEGPSWQEIETLFQRALPRKLCAHIYTENHVYAWNLNEDEIRFLDGRMAVIPFEGNDLTFMKEEKPIKMLFESLDDQVLRNLEKELAPYAEGMEVSYSSNRYLEYNKKGVSKGNGLRRLADLLGVDISQTMAIGDNWNDYSMLDAAGLAIGVANVNPEVAGYCDYICSHDHNHDAVAEAIDRFILTE